MKKVFIDSDIFVIDLRYQKDKNWKQNRKFLDKIKKTSDFAATSIFNVLEVCGIISFNLSQEKLMALVEDFPKKYHVKILMPANPQVELMYDTFKILEQIQKKQSLGDAEVSYVVKRFEQHLSAFVSWNAKHFDGKIPLPVYTPTEYLNTLK